MDGQARTTAPQKAVVAAGPPAGAVVPHSHQHHVRLRDSFRAFFSQIRSSRRQYQVQQAAANLGRAPPGTPPPRVSTASRLTEMQKPPSVPPAPVPPAPVLPSEPTPLPTPCEAVGLTPEAALGQLNEKTLLDARALCLEKLRALKELNRAAHATLHNAEAGKDQEAEVARLQQEVRQREAEIKRWGCRVRVADSELRRRGLSAPPSSDTVGTRQTSQGDLLGGSDK